MSMRADVVFEAQSTLAPAAVQDHLLKAIAYGTTFGPGLVVSEASGQSVRFKATSASAMVDSGHIELERTHEGTRVTFTLICRAVRRRHLWRAAMAGGCIGLAAVVAFGWLIVVSTPIAIAASLATDQLSWRAARRTIRTRAEAAIRNFEYLGPQTAQQ